METIDSFSKAREKMVHDQIMQRGIMDPRVLEAFRLVPRHLFVPEEYVQQAYTDHPLPIGFDQTISQPYIVALMSNCLDLDGDEKVLEIGTGSGYQTAILAQLAKKVYSVELVEDLSIRAKSILKLLGINNVCLSVGDGSIGLPAHQPYDRIIMTAAVPFLSEEIKNQITPGGMIVAPVGDRSRQTLEIWKREKNGFIKEKILPVVFVPLRGKHGWQDD
jgi:protein-L-isoaspartate(D-aspartate) O-methyltransferase